MKTDASIRAALLVSLALLGACHPGPPSRFYRLAPLAAERRSAAPDTARIVLAVAPVAVAGYLDQPQMADTVTANEIRYAEFDRWSQRLQDLFAQVLAENLGALVGTDQVYVSPLVPAKPADYQVTVYLASLDGSFSEPCRLDARWLVRNGAGQDVTPLRRSLLMEQAAGGDHRSVAAAQSRALLRLSEEIAAVITAHARKR